MDKENIQRTKQSFSFIVSAIYRWVAESIHKSEGKLDKDDFYIISENMLNDLKSNLTKDAQLLFNIVQREFEDKLSNNIFEQTKKDIGWK